MPQTSASLLFHSICTVGLPLSLFLAGLGCSSTPASSGTNAPGGGSAVLAGGSSASGAGAGGAPNAAGGNVTSGGSGAQAAAGSGATGAATHSGGSDSGGATSLGGSTGAPAGGAGAVTGGAGGSVGVAGAAGSSAAGGAPTHNEFVLYDDNGGNLLYVNNAKPSMNWTTKSGTGRDLQLIGGGLVMLGKSDGWDEYRLSDGVKSGGQHGLAGTQAVHRLADGTTVLATVSGTSIVLNLVTTTGQMKSQITYPGFSYVRLVRPTSSGTYLVAADTVVFEGDASGKVLSQIAIPGGMHTWKAMRLANGNIAVTSGYGATLVVFDATGKLLVTMGGKDQPMATAIAPQFYADFHVMPSGNFFVANSQADRVMDNSIQLLEYNSAGLLVWQQKQPMGIHSVEEAIVLDGLDTSKLQVEPAGQLVSAP